MQAGSARSFLPTFLRGDANRVKDFVIFFSSDVHGSERCWMKFVNAAKAYGATALVMGGDLTGKAIQPLVRTGNDSYEMTAMGRHTIFGAAELPEIEKQVRFNGFYPYICEQAELARLAEDPEYLGQVFRSAMTEQLERWLSIAKERLEPAGVQCYVMPGNDDEFFIDEVLANDPFVVNPDLKIVRVGPYQMLSCSWTPVTPWDSPRECSEEELADKLRTLSAKLEPDIPIIFNLHSPPYNTGLDEAPQLNPDLSMVTVGGHPKVIPVGSRAVRALIEEIQPIVALHGHIHESRGRAKIGRTVCLNPGSSYSAGTLDGCIVTLSANGLRGAQLVRA